VIGLALIFLMAAPMQADDGTGTDSESPSLESTYLGQKPPGKKAELFAPEVLIHEPHDSPLISPDETWFVFPGMDVDILFYKLVEGRLTEVPNPLGFEIPEVCNGLAIAPSQDRVYIEEWKDGGDQLYYIDREGDGWTSPTYVDFTRPGNMWQFTITANGGLYFGWDKIMVSVWDGGSHADAVPLKLEDGSDMPGGSPYLPPDEAYIIYSIDGDLHISYNLNNSRWTMPVDLGPDINSDQLELCPQITPNGKYLLFNSRRGGPDWAVYWADAGFVEELKPEGVE
jgi:hypothetical protein